MKFHDISALENMIISILDEGAEEVWNEIEKETDALTRCAKHQLFEQAIHKIKNRS